MLWRTAFSSKVFCGFPRLPTPVFLPGGSHGQRSLVGCSPGGGHKIAEHGWATECAGRDEWSAEGSNIEMSSGFKKNFIYSFAVLGFVAARASV